MSFELSDLVEKWLNHLVIKNLSVGTVSEYRLDLKAFENYLDHKKLDIHDIELSDLREYVTFLVIHQHLSKVTIARKLSAIRTFCKWLQDYEASCENDHAFIDTISGIRIKTDIRKLPNILSIEEMIAFLDADPPDNKRQQELWIRDKAILELFYSSGLRVSELINVKLTDLDFDQNLIKVKGKGNKERIVPVGSKCIHAIKAWLGLRLQWQPQTDHLFLSKTTGKGMTRGSVFTRVKYHAQRCGITQKMYPHLLRHCFATHMLSESQQLRAVQEMLGHSNLSTTAFYTHLDHTALVKSYDHAHPRAFKK
ncbi:MAG: tyrosine recombinase XerC [Acinetobacter sp.]